MTAVKSRGAGCLLRCRPMTTTRTIPLSTTKIRAEVEQGVGWITLANPERHNAISLEMWHGLADAAEALEADAAVRAVVIAGEGGKAFTAGGDVSEYEKERGNAELKKRYGAVASRAQQALARLTRPLVAMVQGHCIGGGVGIALLADVRLAGRNARFSMPAARLGLCYEYPVISALARVVGPAAAADLLFSARTIGADEALRVGLANQVFDDESLQAETRAYAQRIAANAPLTVGTAKTALRVFQRFAGNLHDEGADDVARLVNRCFDSDDYREGRSAFVEKRTPVFKGC